MSNRIRMNIAASVALMIGAVAPSNMGAKLIAGIDNARPESEFLPRYGRGHSGSRKPIYSKKRHARNAMAHASRKAQQRLAKGH